MKKHYLAPRDRIQQTDDVTRGLTAREREKFQKIMVGEDPYAANQEWRELIEAKSRFIPKIWSDL